ncbi:hypothetical protein WJ0W_000896 [Paenibacillus melissococcoides]|uniref:Uncharacterized protein n=1 Tax=Paenibacillus melissococcoides TaxID=2912268 RepID=A0ABN8TY20_9BACL|nr:MULTISPECIES: hypothetical protein [Paenibacillus]MEB9892568.1 hypothetical protein [Bacillus cereus]CAH8243656.1 hypothetical protein WJ0W_000896 [Paenibacillus melissococcoides]CAH8704982.1 hypothetical protein HTL2_000754 [Paenibacillus melissococcoides]CAH8707754.1 hypothetical protein WDD9_001717 [Paenibacillus melissococcoides]GIO77460.1 hypothetical protein J6TS7_10700 [Paenibacillus dendritiformis]
MNLSIQELTDKMLKQSEGDIESLMSYVLGLLEGSLIAVDRLGTDAKEAVPQMRTILFAYHRAYEKLRGVDPSQLN